MREQAIKKSQLENQAIPTEGKINWQASKCRGSCSPALNCRTKRINHDKSMKILFSMTV